jgi:hypothetical protein
MCNLAQSAFCQDRNHATGASEQRHEPHGPCDAIAYTTLTRSDRYVSDRGSSWTATYPAREAAFKARLDRTVPTTVGGGYIDQTPSTTVVATVTADTGVGNARTVTEYAYRGYKVDQHGRGPLGFREIRAQSDAPDGLGKLITLRRKLQVYPFVGNGAVIETYLGTMSPIAQPQAGQLLSRVENVYCDQTAAAGAENTATLYVPCPTTAKVLKPYLRMSTQTATDLAGVALPSVVATTTYSGGYPTLIERITTGVGPAGNQSFTSRTTNEYFPDNISGDNWLLGLLRRTSNTNIVPNSLAANTTTAGNAPKATATAGP